jgi:excinuclease ABC subunit A
VDRIVIKAGMEQRLADSFETALNLADGIAIAEWADRPRARNRAGMLFSEKFACPVSGFTISEIEPRLFSFNNPFGACPACDGLGEQLKIRRRIWSCPTTDKTSARARSRPGPSRPLAAHTQTLQALAKHYGFSIDKAWNKLPEVREGDPLRHRRGEVDFVYDDGARYEGHQAFEGVSATWSAAGARPTAPGCARNSAATSPSALPHLHGLSA